MNKRQNYRQDIDLIATLHTKQSSHNILIKDISIGGLQIQLQNGSLPAQKEVILDIPIFKEIRAVIAWSNDTSHGIKFLDCPQSVHSFVDNISTHGLMPHPDMDLAYNVAK